MRFTYDSQEQVPTEAIIAHEPQVIWSWNLN